MRKSVFVLAAVVLLAAVLAPGARSEEGGATYLGNKKCKICHMKQFKSWEGTAMGAAFGTLQAGQKTAEKEKVGLDPAKDYTQDPKCLRCHTVGFDKAGGYKVPAADDDAAAKDAGEREGVGCESCHGPGSAYAVTMKANKEYKLADIQKEGYTEPNAAACEACHNPESPFFNKEEWSYEKMKAKGIHDHVPLKKKHD